MNPVAAIGHLDLSATPAMVAGAVAVAGLVQAFAGLAAVWRFRRRLRTAAPPRVMPRVSVLKPLHGDEPMLEDALASFCTQDYPDYQVVFGLHDAGDAALATVERLRARFPALDTEVVIDPTLHGSNRKIGNLLNMLPAARHDLLVIADSDIHVAPDYLRQVVGALAEPRTGVVTTLYAGLPAHPGLPALFGAAQINHAFLPGVLLARAMGRQACLGATMALRRATLERAGGLAALANQLADDAILGELVNGMGLDVRIAPTLTATTVPEADAASLFHHEMRWARTTRSLAPIGFALSAIQYPLFWALLAVALSGGGGLALALFAATWVGRAATGAALDALLRLETGAPIWLLPFRDVLSVSVILLSYGGDNVQWRGQRMSAARPRLLPGKG